MAKKRKKLFSPMKKGRNNFLKQGIWLFFVFSFLMAIGQMNNIHTIEDVYSYTERKVMPIINCTKDSILSKEMKCGFKINIDKHEIPKKEIKNNSNKQITLISKVESYKQLDSLKVVKEYDKNVKYNRKDWEHWKNYGSSCWNIREEVLYRQAEPNSIILLDKNKQITKNKAKACSIKSGKWKDPYSDEIMTKPQQVDVDHTVALGAVSKAGGNSFSKDIKGKYANDFDVLVATSAKQNRAKGAKTPSQWMPPNKKSHCEYAKTYINISKKYNLSLTEKDKKVLKKALSTCSA